MKTTMLDLFTSKKFLAALSAIVIYLAGRFGFAIDPATLDRIFAALLVYVGAQGLADNGKSAALIFNPPPAAPPANDKPTTGGLAGVVLAAGVMIAALLASCATVQPRERATAGYDAALSCTAAARGPVVDDLAVAFQAWLRRYISGDHQTINLDKLKADALALKGEVVGSCALVTALAILATPKPPSTHESLLAEPDPAQWRGALEAVKLELGVSPGS